VGGRLRRRLWLPLCTRGSMQCAFARAIAWNSMPVASPFRLVLTRPSSGYKPPFAACLPGVLKYPPSPCSFPSASAISYYCCTSICILACITHYLYTFSMSLPSASLLGSERSIQRLPYCASAVGLDSFSCVFADITSARKVRYWFLPTTCFQYLLNNGVMLPMARPRLLEELRGHRGSPHAHNDSAALV